jgi:hypothetical protein
MTEPIPGQRAAIEALNPDFPDQAVRTVGVPRE